MTRPLLIERPVRVPLCKLKNTERLSQISLFSVTTVSLSLSRQRQRDYVLLKIPSRTESIYLPRRRRRQTTTTAAATSARRIVREFDAAAASIVSPR